ncbi:hypothetical protein Sjap_021980 [Stephania japonica]|uniref:Uncharacterized protein n=1 Tax=Stephania japonica TaxID=461633 RepID=A0AAP0ETQ2_9MAGN
MIKIQAKLTLGVEETYVRHRVRILRHVGAAMVLVFCDIEFYGRVRGKCTYLVTTFEILSEHAQLLLLYPSTSKGKEKLGDYL